MSELDSRVDKSISRCYYEISYDSETFLPTTVKMVVLVGLKDTEDKTLEEGEHVAFIFDYAFSNFGSVDRFEVPREVAKLIK